MENELINQALNALQKETGWKIKAKPASKSKGLLDGYLTLQKNGWQETLVLEAKSNLRHHHLPTIEKILKQSDQKLIILSDYISDNLKEELKRKNIFYCDTAGNAYIEGEYFYIFIEGRKNQQQPIKNIFTDASLVLIFALLNHPDLVNKTYREIADEAGVSLDTISKVMNRLKEQGMIVQVDKKNRKLSSLKDLLNMWIIGYGDQLKPKLAYGTYRFLDKDTEDHWQDLPLHPEKTWWGGESGADLLTQYLKPEFFTLYTTETKPALMKKYRLVPDPAGNIQVYKAFWKNTSHTQKNVVSPLLVYVDLVLTAESRNRETAQKIYEQYLANNI